MDAQPARAEYLPHLAAAEIDVLLGPSWPLRPGRALQLVLQELVTTGYLETWRDGPGWPLRLVEGSEPPGRQILASVHRMFPRGTPLSPEGFCDRLESDYQDGLEVHKHVPSGYPIRWLTAMLTTGLIQEGLAEVGEQPGFVMGDRVIGTRTGLNLTDSGRFVAGLLREMRSVPGRSWMPRRTGTTPPGAAPAGPADGLRSLARLTGRSDRRLFRPDDGGLGDDPDAPLV